MLVPVYDIVNCGPRHRFVANGKLVHNSGKLNLQNMGRTQEVSKKTTVGTLIVTPDGIQRFGQLSVENDRARMMDGTVYDVDEIHVAGLRDTLAAPAGKLLVVVDSSNIELRVAHTLAGQSDTVAELRKGTDLYSWFATDLYGYPVHKKTHKKERQHGKVGMLQLQYQSGAGAFKNAARVMGGVILTDDESAKTVQVYRNRFQQIPKAWRKWGNAIEAMANGRREQIDDFGLCTTAHNRLILPSGRWIEYHNLRQEQHPDTGEVNWVYDDKEKRFTKKIYAGQFFENGCQTLARDIVFEQMLRAEQRWGHYEADGNGVVLTAHDEVVLIVDEADAEDCLQHVIQLMSTPPTWWPDLPVAAEGGIGTYYGDAK